MISRSGMVRMVNQQPHFGLMIKFALIKRNIHERKKFNKQYCLIRSIILNKNWIVTEIWIP